MAKPTRFEDYRYLGDKRDQRCYDLDLLDENPAVAEAVDGILRAESFVVFGPDSLAEARNRGYRLARISRVPDAG